MALVDTLTGKVTADIVSALTRVAGSVTGKDTLNHKKVQTFTNGTGTGQATGYFGTTFTATVGGITISLADSDDPLAAAGDDTPSSDPDGLKLRAIMIENLDGSNYIEVEQGTNGLTSWIVASGDKVRIIAGGVLLQTFPAGLDTMNDGADDEIKITANSSSVSVKISYIYG